MHTLQGKIVMITGATSGIGRSAALEVAKSGATIVIVCRSREKGIQTKAWIEDKTGNKHVDILLMDLASMSSIRQGIQRFKERYDHLDILINNAGVLPASKEMIRTEDGHELSFGVNFLAPFLLTHLLLEHLKKSGIGRIVNVSSSLHIPGSKPGPEVDFDFNNLQGEKYYQPMVFYKNSKLAMMWFTYELHRRWSESGITVNAMCPGFVPESISEHQAGIQKWVFRHIVSRLPQATSLKSAGEMEAWMASSPELARKNGRFFVNFQEAKSSDESYDVVKAANCWELAYQMCKLSING
ncbi:SDR family NAD(P)-dependent oxidoreductase [Bacillus sp. 1P10SD]|uniref:SDR family NAD(P)-dependent oxidoreductase n=1 Tax=Bacillus sp. 1P10SD TaxID=3132265 RepID=UPI0039A485AD